MNFLQTYQFEHFQHLFPALGFIPDAHGTQGLFQNPANRFGRVQRAVGILKHHLGADGVDRQFAFDIGDQPQQAFGKGGLTRARLAHQTDDLALTDGERHVFQITQAAFALSVIAGKVLCTDDHGRTSPFSLRRVGREAISRLVYSSRGW